MGKQLYTVLQMSCRFKHLRDGKKCIAVADHFIAFAMPDWETANRVFCITCFGLWEVHAKLQVGLDVQKSS